jgi:glycogen operon protein
MGLTNYWGYNTIGFFAVEPRLGSTPHDAAATRAEFRAMVAALHAAGIEVILDVVFNHTAESDALGPAVSFKGLDNATYYRLPPDARSAYDNYTGCGNTVDLRHPRVLQLVMDSLRYWVEEMHVDGYRFDLAPVLGRGDEGFMRQAAFFAAVAQDPVLAGVKMIAEPWDLGPGGYQVGGFPNGWAEWNDKYRDDMRAFWLRHPATRGGFAQRLCASSDLYQARGRAPAESVNYVISHDGFTLRDLLSYNERHNLANGEDNRDGTGHNLSFNAGVEGPSDDPAVNQLRGRLQRAVLATLLLAQGTPMLCAGDELGHTQSGNNNP